MTDNRIERNSRLDNDTRGGMSSKASKTHAFSMLLLALAVFARPCDVRAEVPSRFTDELVLDGSQVDLHGWYCPRFSPDGRKNGEIVRIIGGEEQPRTVPFAGNLFYRGGDGIEIAPVAAEIGPDGQLYYTMREYGEYSDLRRIRYLGDQAGRRTAAAAGDTPHTTPVSPSSAKGGIAPEQPCGSGKKYKRCCGR